MKTNAFATILLLGSGILFTSCRKKPDPPVPPPVAKEPAVRFQFTNTVGTSPLKLDTCYYTTQNGESFVVNNYKYYISNIVLSTADGKQWAEPESYHLVDQRIDSSHSFTIKGLPAGKYTSVKFLIGVDSFRNTNGAQTGALDPAHGMFWDWDSGYIMAVLEIVTAQEDIHLLHVAGWKSPHSVLRWVTLDLPTPAIVTGSGESNIHITSDVAEWFKTPNNIKLSDLISVNYPDIADNYADMFKVDHVD